MMYTGGCRRSLARSADVVITATAPSLSMRVVEEAQRLGDHAGVEVVVEGQRLLDERVARRIALARWEMQISAKCSPVVPWCMCRLVIIEKLWPGEEIEAGRLNAIVGLIMKAGMPPAGPLGGGPTAAPDPYNSRHVANP